MVASSIKTSRVQKSPASHRKMMLKHHESTLHIDVAGSLSANNEDDAALLRNLTRCSIKNNRRRSGLLIRLYANIKARSINAISVQLHQQATRRVILSGVGEGDKSSAGSRIKGQNSWNIKN